MSHQDTINFIVDRGGHISNETIYDEIIVLFEKFEQLPSIIFKECTFKNQVRFELINNDKLHLVFHNCIFENDVNILKCELSRIQFSSIVQIESIDISGTFDSLYLDSNDTDIKGNISIYNCTINETIDCSNLHISQGQFTLSLHNSEDTDFTSSFKDTTFSVSNFSGYLGTESSFKNFKNLNTSLFDDCRLKEISFKDADFGNNTFFINSIFYSNTSFENCKNLDTTELVFRACLFKGLPHFNESKFNHFVLHHVIFENKVSFGRLEINTIDFYQTSFNNGAYFDELQINKILDFEYINSLNLMAATKWRRTLRVIKQELQKAENKIDYSRFRAYEYIAYKQELTQEITELKLQIKLKDRLLAKNRKYATSKRDLIILKLSEQVSDYGTDWKRALKFTLLFGFIFYIPFFIFENWSHSWDCSRWQVFPIGFLRFFILTDFYNPLGDGKTYIENDSLNHVFSWFIFILGKIVIAFGIYEMIQAFRKFKA
jgi:hypothetical protein